MRLLILITGTGRSGTSTMAGTLHHLGLSVPGPHYAANESNPKGFFESEWAMGFHKRLVRAAGIDEVDARPQAFEAARKAVTPKMRAELKDFLLGHDDLEQLVVKDPRTVWAQWLWQEVAADLDRETRFVTMVRHPAEVLGSRTSYYISSDDPDARFRYQTLSLARWINNSIISERHTRGSLRAFVRYTDLLAGWRPVVSRLADELGFDYPVPPTDGQEHPVDAWIEPDLRRHEGSWSEVAVPKRLREIADEVWRGLLALSAGADEAAVAADLDRSSARYTQLHAEAALIARDDVVGALNQGRRQGRRKLRQQLRKQGYDV